MTARRLLVLSVALLLVCQIIRNAAISALAGQSPDTAARIWADHPNAEITLGMTQIGRAARDRKPVPDSVFALVRDAAVKTPLAPEPFLVRGVQAQLAGDTRLSTQAFIAAEQRDPRSLPAHYFLADRYFRAGDASRGLIEVAALARLAPGGIDSLAPYIAAYARDRSTWPQLRMIFETNPELESASLAALATNAANADAIMALADKRLRGPQYAWVATLLNSLVQTGQYAKARAIWAAVSRVRIAPGQTVYDQDFSDPNAPQPFNWDLVSSTVGLAERQNGKRLHIIFYGQEDGLIARQLLVLSPGHYRLTMGATGNLAQARSLNWSIRCANSQTPFSAIRLDIAASRPWTFIVPQECEAQWLELSGVSSDVARRTDIVIGGLKLVAEKPYG